MRRFTTKQVSFPANCRNLGLLVLIVVVATQLGCQSTRYWWNNNKMVGPNYAAPSAPVAQAYQTEHNVNELTIETSGGHIEDWWQVFGDPDLNAIVENVRSQNLSLKTACYRIKEARHLRNIAAANLFPQDQAVTGAYAHSQLSREAANALPFGPLSIDDWSTGFDASWEVDLWGRIRRSIDASDAQVEARVHDYHFAMVTLVADAASLYIQIRSLDEQIQLAKQNVKLQEGSLRIATDRFDEGRTDKLDVVQAESNLATTRSLIPQFELARRQSLNALAVLMGIPPSDVPSLSDTPGQLPVIPSSVIVGIPAELLMRRPDIRAAERNMKSQFEQIGIAEANMYPTFAVSGSLGWQAASISDLFETTSFIGTIAPGFRWNILNYGRLKQAICVEESVFKQIQYDFQNEVLNAQREVEDSIIEFIKKNEQYEYDLDRVNADAESVKLAVALFTEGKSDFGRVFIVQSNLVLAQDNLVATRASICQALINTYRSLGGGWETGPECQNCGECILCPGSTIAQR